VWGELKNEEERRRREELPDGGVVELQDVLLVIGLAVDKVARELQV
jgi:ribosome-associated protein YbcJ (S4-like RNA binding protein)